MVETLDFQTYRVVSPVVSITAAGTANIATLFTVSNTVAQIGTKSFKIKKIMAQNLAAGTCWLYIGTGLTAGTFASSIPAVRLINSLDNEWQEVNIPSAEFFANVTGYIDTLVAGGSVNVALEGEEVG